MRVLAILVMILAAISLGGCILYIAARFGGHRSIYEFPKTAGCLSWFIAAAGTTITTVLVIEILINTGSFYIKPKTGMFGGLFDSSTNFDRAEDALVWTTDIVLITLCLPIIFFLWLTSEEQKIKSIRREEEAAERANAARRSVEHAQDTKEAGSLKLRAYLTDMRRATREIDNSEADAIGIEMMESAVDGILTDTDITKVHINDATIQTDIQLILHLLTEKGYGNDMVTERIREHLVQK